MEKSPITKLRQAFFYIFEGLDRRLGLILLGLATVGFLTFLSASQNTPVLVEDELRNLALSFVVMWIVSRIPPKWLELAAVWIYSLGVLLLVAVAAFGLIKKGARRWLNIGVVIQPSEIMKIAMPLMLAWYFQKREGIIKTWDYGVAAVILGIPVLLIARQPDLGTALLVFAAGLYVIILAGLPWKWILPFVAIGVVGILLIIIFGGTICQPDIAWPFIQDYQKHRVCTLLDPSSDPLGKGFHTIQSMIAIGSGGFFGKGWFQGTQAHLEFIPEKHTDFVFAVYSEEFGLLGNFILLALFFALIKRGLTISASAPNLFTRLLGASVTLIFFTYAFVNIGMVSGLLPVVGVPLPFISYGGTALVTLGFGAGILMSIHRHRRLVQS
ncbi:rod shape-determining protein RodA [Polynucleobacter sphagniphilus]|jgi:rod shape determining protein RodA|uniref:Peptidoglycan glycosyltransferase MrdB n=1 Tax=Polynucleobacter sphagniphilus TaxID=1743169 RepID=A0AA43M7W1_9BURK|nr:rod shape-determining protein RodA [Polynucleobacter sphagniphilus]MDF9788459.1 rod shape determining protein RodA [Polynucleobacter sphagniphilus]MDH6155038.1 rod shape determining protein RodA [Polynucleobacter sphagniphilus]MDH6241627.1 rod shape determining protein RodA [Polynucleobacter sphagniphilus]MDH6248941.1 rod shape determining protein RodA [Polynucleobacter sphagniphilus]MDH6299551.1 rod shape determining protein RodA [Polynucleobacter sphagniphilus]